MNNSPNKRRLLQILMIVFWALSGSGANSVAQIAHPDQEALIDTLVETWRGPGQEPIMGETIRRQRGIHTGEVGASQHIVETIYRITRTGTAGITAVISDSDASESRPRNWHVFNRDYYFEVRENSDGQFGVRRVVDLSQLDSDNFGSRMAHRKLLRGPPWSYMFFTIYWSELFSSAGFQLARVEEVDWNGIPALAIHFDYDPERHDGPHEFDTYSHHSHFEFSNSHLVLLPDHRWVPVSGEFTVRSPIVPEDDQAARWEYGADYDLEAPVFPRVRQKTFTIRSLDGREVLMNVTQEFEYRTDKQFRSSEFYLSAFGLPEPDWYVPTYLYWLYFSTAGFILLVIGALLLRFGSVLFRSR